jgi:hypothetical protein
MISYRRADSGIITGRIFDRLIAHYGREAVFRDIDNIPFGVDFRKHVDKVLGDSDLVLAVVGPQWFGRHPWRSRLNSPEDPVRVEIEAALKKSTPLIPVLVLGARMPRAASLPKSVRNFAYRNAVTVDADRDFDVHISRLLHTIDSLIEQPTEHAAVESNKEEKSPTSPFPTFGDDRPNIPSLPGKPERIRRRDNASVRVRSRVVLAMFFTPLIIAVAGSVWFVTQDRGYRLEPVPEVQQRQEEATVHQRSAAEAQKQQGEMKNQEPKSNLPPAVRRRMGIVSVERVISSLFSASELSTIDIRLLREQIRSRLELRMKEAYGENLYGKILPLLLIRESVAFSEPNLDKTDDAVTVLRSEKEAIIKAAQKNANP